MSTDEQARAATESALVVRFLDRSAIVASGGDARSWLNGMLTCDVAQVGSGKARYGLLVEKKGRIQADMFVVPSAAADGALVLAVPTVRSDETLATLDHHLIMEDVELTTPRLALYMALGPKAPRITAEVRAAFAGEATWLGTDAGFYLVAEDAVASFEDELRAALERHGGALGTEAGYEALRIERGIPRFGVEVDTTLYPQEAALETIGVSFTKGCYLGQEVVYMLEHRGHAKRKLSALAVAGHAPPTVGAPVTTPDGEAVGEIRSAIVGPRHETVRAIAMLKWASAKVGTELRVGDSVARVSAAPWLGDASDAGSPSTPR